MKKTSLLFATLMLAGTSLPQSKLPSPCYVLVYTGPFLPTGTSAATLVNCSLFTPPPPPPPVVGSNLPKGTIILLAGAHHNVLTWQTPATSSTIAKYNILRSSTSNGTFQQLGITAAVTNGNPGGGTVGWTGGGAYSDSTASPGVTSYYQVQALDSTGKVLLTSNTLPLGPPKTSPATLTLTGSTN